MAIAVCPFFIPITALKKTEPANITKPRSSRAAAGSLCLGVSTGSRLSAGLSVLLLALCGCGSEEAVFFPAVDIWAF